MKRQKAISPGLLLQSILWTVKFSRHPANRRARFEGGQASAGSPFGLPITVRNQLEPQRQLLCRLAPHRATGITIPSGVLVKLWMPRETANHSSYMLSALLSHVKCRRCLGYHPERC
ncbi:hypothetical protein VTN96DRAFT_4329 [Rasamsonia emersonii]